MNLKKTLLIIGIIVICVLLSAQIVKFKVDSKTCIGCGICVQSKACPTTAISLKNGKAVIDPEKCIGCGICQKGGLKNYRGCPVNSFSSYEVASPTIATREVKEEKSELKKEVIVEKDTKTKIEDQTATKKVEKDSTKTKIVKEIGKIIYTVEKSLCIGCNLCVSQCPTKAISNVNGKAVIDQEKCISCGLCKNGNPSAGYRGCPVNAIKTNE